MSKAAKPDHTLLLVDTHALIHRAYHAFPPTLRTADGEAINAVYGFAKLLLDVLLKFKPSHVVALSDAPGPTIRHQQYGAYKAHRQPLEDDLVSQFSKVEELVSKFNIPWLQVSGYEADDLIGTIDARHSGDWAQTIVVTGDRDLFQLVDNDTFIYLAGSQFSQSKLFDAAGVEEKMGIGPEYITDLKGLYGDTSDNIPGVYGIGEKGAVGLIRQFGHIDQIYENVDRIEKRYKDKLLNNYEQAQLSKQLATIVTDAPVAFDFEANAQFGDFDRDTLRDYFQKMRFRSLQGSLEKLEDIYLPKPAKTSSKHSSDQLGLGVEPVDLDPWIAASTKDAEDIFMLVDVNKQSDPLGWEFNSIYVSDGTETWGVNLANISEMYSAFSGKRVYTFDVKAIYHALTNAGLDPDQIKWHDLGITTYLVTAGQAKPDLESALNYFKQDFSANIATNCPLLGNILRIHTKQLEEKPNLAKLVDMEQSLIPVIVRMERNGICLDKQELESNIARLENLVAETTQQIYDNVGHEFNVSSPKQVAEVLFVEKGLPGGRKTKGGSVSTDERTLRELINVDPVVQKILDYREITKLLSTYVRPLPECVNPITGRIHAVFNQLGAVTGRFSSQNPNLQNIPLGEVGGVNLRSMFIAEQGSVMVAFDYSQQELRLLAELSGEDNMQKAFIGGEDIHARTASEIFDIPLSEVTKEQRKVGKTVNFGVVYGISAFGLADRLKIDQRKAADFINKYFERYPKVKEYYDQLLKGAKAEGVVHTLLGRERETFGLSASNYQLRQATEREVMNFPLQGSAADITKLAMVKLGDIDEEYPVKLILQVHDELVFEYKSDMKLKDLIKDKKFLDFVRNVRQTMLGVTKMNVPLEVGIEVGLNWGEMDEVEIN